MFSTQRFSNRKAISPIIATVLIIAVTLIAAVAIGGFVFGIFGSSSNSGEIQVTGIALTATGVGTAGAGTAACATATSANDIVLTNTGTAAASATSVSITYGGSVYTWSFAAACVVTAAGLATGNPMVVTLTDGAVAGATSGASYTGTVTMSNGAILIFAGTFI